MPIRCAAPSARLIRLAALGLVTLLATSACSEGPQNPGAGSAPLPPPETPAASEADAKPGAPLPPLDDFNNHNISRNSYLIDPGFVSEAMLAVGDGIDMSDPGAPQRRTGRQPLNLAQAMRLGGPVEDYTLTESFRLEEASSVSEEAGILSAYFKGAYGIVSGDAALDRAREDRTSSRSIYAVVEAKGQVQDIRGLHEGPILTWRADMKPLYEDSAEDEASFRRQFLQDYGSHYVSAITYGYRVAIRGKITSTDTKSDQKIKAAFKAAFVSGSAEGGVSKEDRKTLQENNVELIFAATSGGLYVDGESRPGILTRLDDILQMLEDMKSGKVKIHAAPLNATVRTYWYLLPAEFERSRRLLADHGSPPIPEPLFGVPRGTIVPWHPPESALRTDTNGTVHIVPPPGWLLCNGEDGTPDLRDRFVRGTADPAALAKAAGSDTHRHGGSTGKLQKGGTADHKSGIGGSYSYASTGHTHGFTTADATVDPPHVKLAFIMKR